MESFVDCDSTSNRRGRVHNVAALLLSNMCKLTIHN